MYTVSACVNDVAVVSVPLHVPGFAVDAEAVCARLSAEPSIKLVYLCSPGNPTGALISPRAVDQILAHPTWNGILVVDEAYVDFATTPDASSATRVTQYPNLVVMQTLSKAFGLAGLRLGYAFCAEPVAALLNALKAPYNISSPTSALACAALRPRSLEVGERHKRNILAQRARLVDELPRVKGVGKIIGGLDANFVLVEMLDAAGRASNEVAVRVYEELAGNRGVVVRFRGKEAGCLGCLRITVGTEGEVGRFLSELGGVLAAARREVGSGVLGKEAAREEKREEVASAVVT